MPYLYLICSVIFVASDTITGGLYNRKNDNQSDTSSLYALIKSITLCLYNGKTQNGSQKITLRWLNYVALSFISNAACSVIQKTQQLKFDGQFGSFLKC